MRENFQFSPPEKAGVAKATFRIYTDKLKRGWQEGEANVDKNEGEINMHQKEGGGSPSVCLRKYMYTSFFFHTEIWHPTLGRRTLVGSECMV